MQLHSGAAYRVAKRTNMKYISQYISKKNTYNQSFNLHFSKYSNLPPRTTSNYQNFLKYEQQNSFPTLQHSINHSINTKNIHYIS
jgi:hypothetical protein